MQYEKITIRKPDDMHVHFRQGNSLGDYAKCTARYFARALVMPNTVPAIRNLEDMHNYRKDISNALTEVGYGGTFEPLMSFKIYPDSVGEVETWLQEACNQQAQREESVSSIKVLNDELSCASGNWNNTNFTTPLPLAGKLYPQGATTNAEDGVADISQIYKTLEFMQKHNIVLCIHGEEPQAFVLEREIRFLDTLDRIRSDFPALRIVLEHISTKEAVHYVCEANKTNQSTATKPNTLAATITVHHLLYTLDALLGGFLNPHMFCKPLLKAPKDLEALQQAVLDGTPNIFLGTDSAPHKIGQKECACGCAGIFSSPVALALLTEFFYQHRETISTRYKNKTTTEEIDANVPAWVQALESFASKFGADFYNLPYNKAHIVLERSTWTVPQEIASVVPLCAGAELWWQLVED